ncbi:MAG: DUF922 domain-containing Zn-dependent protease [Flavobacteriaceae bacterium]|nr:DUF922 domain-containing Zn-dependent protease [Flavobacteriaceae bacterium]
MVWEDFQGKVPKNAKFESYTRYEIVFRYNYETEVNPKVYFDKKKSTWKTNYDNYVPKKIISVETKVFIRKKTSWVKKDKKSDDLLNHEQKHLDIALYFERKLNQALSGLLLIEKNPRIFSAKAREIAIKIINENLAFQSEYDKKTNHGKDMEQQKIYDEKINKMLAEFEN